MSNKPILNADPGTAGPAELSRRDFVKSSAATLSSLSFLGWSVGSCGGGGGKSLQACLTDSDCPDGTECRVDPNNPPVGEEARYCYTTQDAACSTCTGTSTSTASCTACTGSATGSTVSCTACTGTSTGSSSGCSSCSGSCSASCKDSCHKSCSGTCSGGCKNLTS